MNEINYEQVYQDFWKKIVENPNGTLNKDAVMRELGNYQIALDDVSVVYFEITNGCFSKLNTDPNDVIEKYWERIQGFMDTWKTDILNEFTDEQISREELKEFLESY